MAQSSTNTAYPGPIIGRKMAAINVALASCSTEHPVFYEDEVDIHLNPKSVLTGSYVGSKSALSRRVRMKSTILRVRCTAVREKSATLVETVKFVLIY
jgi:hypothetical protein